MGELLRKQIRVMLEDVMMDAEKGNLKGVKTKLRLIYDYVGMPWTGPGSSQGRIRVVRQRK
jgi:hypothetical protein